MSDESIKYAFIPRADTLIGLHMAKELLKRGYHVVVHAQSQARMLYLKSQLHKQVPNGSYEFMHADLSSAQDTFWLMKTLMLKVPQIDCLVWPLLCSHEPDSSVHYSKNVEAFYLILCAILGYKKPKHLYVMQFVNNNHLPAFASNVSNNEEVRVHCRDNWHALSQLQRRYRHVSTVTGCQVRLAHPSLTERALVDGSNTQASWQQRIWESYLQRTSLTQASAVLDATLSYPAGENNIFSTNTYFGWMRTVDTTTKISIDSQWAATLSDRLYTRLRVE